MIYSSYNTKNGLWFDYKNVKIIRFKEVKNANAVKTVENAQTFKLPFF